MKLLCVLACMATNQDQVRHEVERVRAVVVKLMGPKIDWDLPVQRVAERVLYVEPTIRVEEADEELDKEPKAEPLVIPVRKQAIASKCFDEWVFGNIKRRQVEWIDSFSPRQADYKRD